MIRWIMVLMLMLSLFSTVEAKESGLEEMPFPLGMDISDRFTGTVHRNDLINADDVYKIPQTNVITFEPGSYSGWQPAGDAESNMTCFLLLKT